MQDSNTPTKQDDKEIFARVTSDLDYLCKSRRIRDDDRSAHLAPYWYSGSHAVKQVIKDRYPCLPMIDGAEGVVIKYQAAVDGTERYRLRLSNHIKNKDGKQVRYLAQSGVAVGPFLPSSVESLGKEAPLHIVEGPLKAMTLSAHEIASVGLGGINTCVDQNGLLSPAKEWQAIGIAGRHCVVCMDAGINTNPDVARAAARLARALKTAGAESVEIKYVPLHGGKDQGPDDYLCRFPTADDAVCAWADLPTTPADLLDIAKTPEGADSILARASLYITAALSLLDDGQRVLLARRLGCPIKAIRVQDQAQAQKDPEGRTLIRGDHQELAETIIGGLGDQATADGEEVYAYNPATGVYDHIHSDVLANKVGALAGTPTGAKGYPLHVSSGTRKGACQVMVEVLRAGKQGYFAASKAIGFTNGVLRMVDGEIDVDDDGNPRLHPHSPDNRLLASYDWAWDPADADQVGDLCRMCAQYMACGWEDFNLLLEMVGVSLWGLAPRYNRMLVLLGAAGSGKSTILNLIKACTPPAIVCSVAPQDMGHEYNRAALQGKRLNLVYDLPQREIMDTGELKQIITGDLVSARRLYQDPVSIQPVAGHIYGANALPRHTDDSGALLRRSMVIEFPAAIADKHPRALDCMLEHKRAFVAAAMVSAATVASRGDYAIPANSHRIVDEWCGDANNVWVWAADRVDANGSALMSDLYKDYASWTKDNGYKAQAIKTFGASLRTYATRISTKLMVEHTKHGNRCDGLSLRASAMHSMI